MRVTDKKPSLEGFTSLSKVYRLNFNYMFGLWGRASYKIIITHVTKLDKSKSKKPIKT